MPFGLDDIGQGQSQHNPQYRQGIVVNKDKGMSFAEKVTLGITLLSMLSSGVYTYSKLESKLELVSNRQVSLIEKTTEILNTDMEELESKDSTLSSRISKLSTEFSSTIKDIRYEEESRQQELFNSINDIQNNFINIADKLATQSAKLQELEKSIERLEK